MLASKERLQTEHLSASKPSNLQLSASQLHKIPRSMDSETLYEMFGQVTDRKLTMQIRRHPFLEL